MARVTDHALSLVQLKVIFYCELQQFHNSNVNFSDRLPRFLIYRFDSVFDTRHIKASDKRLGDGTTRCTLSTYYSIDQLAYT